MDVQTALLRIAQGAVANVAQHADASVGGVGLAVTAAHATLTVRDDGMGFDPARVGADAGASDSFGLRAMAQRVEQLGGTLDVDSAPGRGTTITAILEVEA